MFCRRAWQTVGPLARWLLKPISRSTAPVRHMAFGVPGGSSNMAYVVLCGGGLTAAVVYAYKTVNGDTERYEDRLANVSTKEKAEVTSEAVSPAVETTAAEEEPAPAPVAEMTAEPVPASPEPVAETSAEPTADAASEEPEADVAEASAEPAAAGGAASVAEEEAAPEAAPEDEPVKVAEDTAAAESAAVKALASSTLEIINVFVGEENLVKSLQMGAGGNELNSLKEALEPETLAALSERTTVETSAEAFVGGEEGMSSTHGLTIEELCAEQSPAPAAEQEQEERAASLPEEIPEAEENTVTLGSAPEEAVSSSEASAEDSATSDETSLAEEVVVPAEATPEEETTSEQITLERIGETTQLAAASTEQNREVLSATEPEPPSSVGAVDEEEPCHNCHTSPSSSMEAAPPAALGEDPADTDVTQEAKETSTLTKHTMENGVMVTAQS
ncbi:fibrous sheath CABYR-binding protein [Fundulus heteroclitus]|uniref:fibrous sheath CABYR-binding protein n=1 Tax=Fundulus heteroclitus TaxID=8078 RepID=UPI00165B141A|nr:fibrous sheath CABYR-binding protein [Fundulus heteroclitus]